MLLASSMAVSLLLGVTGCSAGDKKASGGKGDTTAGSGGEAEKIALTVWSPAEDQDPSYGQWLNTMCEKFDDLHPEWDVTFTYGVCTESDVKSTVPQDIDAAADVFLFSSTGLENLCQSDCLTEFGGKYLEEIRNNYPAVLVDSLNYEGGVYGVPMTTNTFFMYYDKRVFSEDDVKSLDQMLTKGKVAIPLANGFYSAAFYLGAGCSFFGPEGKDREAGISLNGESTVAMTDYLVDLVANKNMVVAEPDAAISMLREGTVFAYWCGTWQAAQTREILGENFGVAALPCVSVSGKQVQLKPFSSSKAVGVKSTTQYPEAAIELALYLGSDEAQKLHYDTRSYVPCHLQTLKDEKIQKDEVVMTDAYTIANIAVPRSNFREMSYFWMPAESFGHELRDGVITHDNAREKTEAFHKSANSPGVQ